MRLAGPTDLTEYSTAREPEGHLSPLRLDGTAALSTLVERGHHSELTQARRFEPKQPPRRSDVAQMPQGDSRRVEQLGVRVVKVRQIGQQFGNVVAGIQGRKIAAKRWKASTGGLGQQFSASLAFVRITISETPRRSRPPWRGDLRRHPPLASTETFPRSRVNKVATELVSKTSTVRSTRARVRIVGTAYSLWQFAACKHAIVDSSRYDDSNTGMHSHDLVDRGPDCRAVIKY